MESYPRSHRLPEPRNEPSLFVIVYVTRMVYWWIDYPRHSTASHIRHWVSDRDMHDLTNLGHSSHQAGTDHSDRTQNRPLNVPHTACVWIEAVWTMESNQIYRSSCRHFFMTKGLPFSLNIECHILLFNHHRYEGKHFHHLTTHNINELEIRVIASRYR